MDEANKAKEADRGCQRGKDDRSSDLCAQWKAADAAKESADWARRMYPWIVAGTIIGGLTLVAAVAAAMFAKSASDGAHEANRIARAVASRAERDAETARQALIRADRAIIRISTVQSEPPPLQTKDGAMITIRVVNIGRTNATDFEVYYALREEPMYATHRLSKLISNDICVPGSPLNLPAFKVRKRSKYPVYIIGYVDYAAAHGSRFKTFFCRRMDGLPTETDYGGYENISLEEYPCRRLPKSS
ncbi:hypothetical protein ABS767_03635 [Sphingomonas sp. ST-64]|uniref:Uncharacterized protein n=1 Tax=Sphingomonas plantiphila TaxID=3163295 RepID=A0ABW8YLF4_9SPHN